MPRITSKPINAFNGLIDADCSSHVTTRKQPEEMKLADLRDRFDVLHAQIGIAFSAVNHNIETYVSLNSERTEKCRQNEYLSDRDIYTEMSSQFFDLVCRLHVCTVEIKRMK